MWGKIFSTNELHPDPKYITRWQSGTLFSLFWMLFFKNSKIKQNKMPYKHHLIALFKSPIKTKSTH